jgi:cell wall-associated NlpC family hydrolase
MDQHCPRAGSARNAAVPSAPRRTTPALAVTATAVAALLPAAPAPAQAPPRVVPAGRVTPLAQFERRLGLVDLTRPAALRVRVEHRAAVRAQASRDVTGRAIRDMVAAGDRIATLPYSYGGGHGSFTSAGYDCSGSVSYVLHAAGLLDTPEDSSGLMAYGEPGPGRHVTIYANPGHALMTIDGRRFDTIALQETGTRWSDSLGATDGYVVRHPPGM